MKTFLFALILAMALFATNAFATKFPVIHNQEVKESIFKGEMYFKVQTIEDFYKKLCVETVELDEDGTLFLEFNCFTEVEWKKLEMYFYQNQDFQMFIYYPGMKVPEYYSWILEMAKYYNWQTAKVIIWKL